MTTRMNHLLLLTKSVDSAQPIQGANRAKPENHHRQHQPGRSAATGLTGKLAAVSDVHGDQVAYNGHLLYTFLADRAGQVTGQGAQGFFAATPGLAPIAGSSAGTVPAA